MISPGKMKVESRPEQRPMREENTVDARVMLALLAHLRRTGSAIVTTEEIAGQTGLPPEIVESSLERIADHGGVSKVRVDQ